MIKGVKKSETSFATINFNSYEDMVVYETEFTKAVEKLQSNK
jgi:hypothetical protein